MDSTQVEMVRGNEYCITEFNTGKVRTQGSTGYCLSRDIGDTLGQQHQPVVAPLNIINPKYRPPQKINPGGSTWAI